MQYLSQIELFVIKKLLLETSEAPKEYLPADFGKYGAKTAVDCLLRLDKEKSLSLRSIKIRPDFFGTIFSSDFMNLIMVDVNERGRPIHAGIDYKAVKDWDYLGLGEKVFGRYKNECCPESSILEPDFDLEVSSDELEHVMKNSLHFPGSYGDALFKNLAFSVCQDKKQKEKLEKYLCGYLEKFRNDELERQSATDYYKYARQKEMIYRTIEHFRRDYPIKNLWLKKSDFSAYGETHLSTTALLGNYNFLETLLCLEQDSKGKGIKIEALDGEKGVRITDYSEKTAEQSMPREEMEEEQQPTPRIDNATGEPYTEVKNGKGYFKFYKQGENIEIGKPETRHFRLLQCLCNPRFGIQKTIEAVFEAIKKPKDRDDSSLESWSPQRKARMLEIIEYTKKELQKNKKLQKRLKYKYDVKKQNMWLELEG